MLLLLNGIAVGIFGMILSISFCDILWTKRKCFWMTGSMVSLLLLQGIVYFAATSEVVRYLYPLITHIPLVVILYVFTKKYLWAVVSVLTAYLCCQLRRWLALFIAGIWGSGAEIQSLSEVMITIPLLFVLLKIVSPSVRSLSHSSAWVQSQFCLIPAVYYIFDYMTQIYTDLLLKGSPVITEFMSFICSGAYLIFVLRFSKEKWIRSQLEQVQDSLNLQLSQSVREIETLRESQRKTAVYRHDLRHHMQYLSSCIENGQLEHAKDYIRGICSEIDTSKVTVFCENEAANLIFSAFAERAKEQEIEMRVKVQISSNIYVSESDLCVLLSNALENALHACRNLKEKNREAVIEVSAFEKNRKLFLQIINSCDADVILIHGIPVTNQPDHGIGVQSICALVERYEGIYTFDVEGGNFILRVSL